MIKMLKNNLEFAKLVGINLFSRMGDRLFYIVMLTWASMLSGAGAHLAITMVSVSETIPILLSFILGSLAGHQTHKTSHLIQNAIIKIIIYIAIGALCAAVPFSLTLILIIAGLNLLSGIAGNYTSALIAPFTKILVKPQAMEQTQGIISITAQLINILATPFGAFLWGYFTTKTIAWMNAGLFGIVLIGCLAMRTTLTHNEMKIKIQPRTHNETTFKIIKKNFSALVQNKFIFNDLCQLALLNGFFGGLTPLFVMDIKTIHLSGPFTRSNLIAVLPIMITLFMLIGNRVSSAHFRKLKNHQLSNLDNAGIILVGGGFLIQNLSLIFLATMSVAFILGLISPRFTTKVINTYPVEHLGGIVTTLNSLLVLTPPVTALLFPLITIIGMPIAYLSFSIYGILLMLLSLIILKYHPQSKSNQ